MVKVTRVSRVSGSINTRELPITIMQLAAWQCGVLAQEAFPHLSASDREFIISGVTPEEWDEMFGSTADLEENTQL